MPTNPRPQTRTNFSIKCTTCTEHLETPHGIILGKIWEIFTFFPMGQTFYDGPRKIGKRFSLSRYKKTCEDFSTNFGKEDQKLCSFNVQTESTSNVSWSRLSNKTFFIKRPSGVLSVRTSLVEQGLRFLVTGTVICGERQNLHLPLFSRLPEM